MAPEEVAALRILVAARSPAAADGLRRMAAELEALADELELGMPQKADAVESISDRVLMGVCGPDGTRHTFTDTQPQPPEPEL